VKLLCVVEQMFPNLSLIYLDVFYTQDDFFQCSKL